MKNEVICRWLGLPDGCWPPDHYTLLGLPPTECDRQRIEQQVHERLAKVRCYQNSHPDQATEAMNRLAQAFMCLSDPDAKICYDKSRELSNGNGAHPTIKINDDTVTNLRTRVDWQAAAPPVRTAPVEATPANGEVVPHGPAVAAETPAVEAANVEPPTAAPAAPQIETGTVVAAPTPTPGEYDVLRATRSLEARRGLGTMPRLIERIEATRQLLWTWDQIGKFLKRKARRLRAEEEKELTQRLAQTVELLETFPKVLGQPGKPGYRVVAIARLNTTARVVTSLDKDQRACLAKDWTAARDILLSYRRFLRGEFKTLRKSSWLGHALRATRTIVHDHPLLILASLVAPAALVIWLILR